MAISTVRRAALLATFEGFLNQEIPDADTPLQNAVGALTGVVHDTALQGQELERAINTSRRNLALVLEGLGMSKSDAQDLTKVLANQEQQGQGSGGPAPGGR